MLVTLTPMTVVAVVAAEGAMKSLAGIMIAVTETMIEEATAVVKVMVANVKAVTMTGATMTEGIK